MLVSRQSVYVAANTLADCSVSCLCQIEQVALGAGEHRLDEIWRGITIVDLDARACDASDVRLRRATRIPRPLAAFVVALRYLSMSLGQGVTCGNPATSGPDTPVCTTLFAAAPFLWQLGYDHFDDIDYYQPEGQPGYVCVPLEGKLSGLPSLPGAVTSAG